MSPEKAWTTIEELARYEEEGWNDATFPMRGSLNHNIEQVPKIKECQVNMLMKEAISLTEKSENMCGLLSNEIRIIETLSPDMMRKIRVHKAPHKASHHLREIPVVDQPKPQVLPNFSPLDVNLGDKRGPIKPHSPDNFKMMAVDKSTINTSLWPHVASFHHKDMYCYYYPCIDDPKKHMDLNQGLGGGGYLKDYMRVVAGTDGDEKGTEVMKDKISQEHVYEEEVPLNNNIGKKSGDLVEMPSEAVEQGMDDHVPDEIDGAKCEQVPNHVINKDEELGSEREELENELKSREEPAVLQVKFVDMEGQMQQLMEELKKSQKNAFF
nr:hypothetical protein [Tanacetum cinerariifolium]